MSVETFMQKYFSDLPNDCQALIYKAVDYRSQPLYTTGDCVCLKTNKDSLFYVLENPIWDYANYCWGYKCKNPKFNCRSYVCNNYSEDRLIFKDYSEVKLFLSRKLWEIV